MPKKINIKELKTDICNNNDEINKFEHSQNFNINIKSLIKKKKNTTFPIDNSALTAFHNILVFNHMQYNEHLGWKKLLLKNLKLLYKLEGKNVFEEILPLTFHVKE